MIGNMIKDGNIRKLNHTKKTAFVAIYMIIPLVFQNLGFWL